MDSQTSTSTIAGDGLSTDQPAMTLDLAELPPVYVLSAHIEMNDLHDLEDELKHGDAPLTYDPTEARLFLGNIAQKRRAVLELRRCKVWSEEIPFPEDKEQDDSDESPARKRRRKETIDEDAALSGTTLQDPDTDSDLQRTPKSHVPVTLRSVDTSPVSSSQPRIRCRVPGGEDVIYIIKLAWLKDSIEACRPLPLKHYTIYVGKRTSKSQPETITETFPKPLASTITSSDGKSDPKLLISGESILERARAEIAPQDQPRQSYASTSQSLKRTNHPTARIAHLVHQSTSEHDLGESNDLPELPDWVKRGSNFSCERVTLLNGPNDAFVDQLKKIRLARTLIDDNIGVRAYSTSIAAVAAYPHTITSQREILALPGCDSKISALWVEWKNNNGFIQAAYDAENDERLKVLYLFYEIWGVGAHTAREFYNKGWRDLDDVVEYGWNTLSRVQQIGLKYYDEFQQKIPRAEVEAIGAKVHEHAQRVREPSGVRTCIVGGYRRGKKESGDVDIIVSHIDEDATLGIVEDIVKSLLDEGWVTHELSTSLSGTRRSQSTLPYRFGGGGHGFDTLDKALVVWQDPRFPGKDEGVKNPNVHRRVDIIISPWSKVGCGVIGWTAGTTFERDLRRYARKVKGWKFDSSGIRDRVTGQEVDLEGVGGRCTSIGEAERKVFKGFGLQWREPWEMNTW